MNHLPQINVQIREEFLRQIKEVEQNFYYLDKQQLNQKPHANAWNAVECIEHLNNTLYLYIKIAESNIRKNSHKKFQKDATFKPGWIARFLINEVEPKSNLKLKKKHKAPKSAQPISSLENVRLNEQKVFQDFNEAIKKLLEINDKATELNYNRISVGTVIGSWARININEMMLYMQAHNRRHILQALRASSVV